MRDAARREAGRLGAALILLTRLPMPATVEHEPEALARAARYFPLAGALVGLVAAVVLLLAAGSFHPPIPALLALLAALLLTGALHEDGLADSADSLGGRTVEARLAIMRDSRLGTYGALALGVVLALRVAAIAALPPWDAAAALVAAGAAARFGAVGVMAATPYAGDRAAAKLDHAASRPRPGEVSAAAAFALLPFALLPPAAAAVGLASGAIVALLVARALCRALGGHTGDVLGAVAAVSETAVLLGVAGVAARP